MMACFTSSRTAQVVLAIVPTLLATTVAQYPPPQSLVMFNEATMGLGGARHAPAEHTSERQSLLAPHGSPVPQPGQPPPQSVAVSLPSRVPSAHLSTAPGASGRFSHETNWLVPVPPVQMSADDAPPSSQSLPFPPSSVSLPSSP